MKSSADFCWHICIKNVQTFFFSLFIITVTFFSQKVKIWNKNSAPIQNAKNLLLTERARKRVFNQIFQAKTVIISTIRPWETFQDPHPLFFDRAPDFSKNGLAYYINISREYERAFVFFSILKIYICFISHKNAPAMKENSVGSSELKRNSAAIGSKFLTLWHLASAFLIRSF